MASSSEWKQHIPVGLRFSPTDQELISYYLTPKVLYGCIKHGGIIADVDIYKYHPYQLNEFAYPNDDGKMYFFTKLTKKDDSDKKSKRSVPGGYWKATQEQYSVQSINNDSKIGTQTSLAFYMHGKTKPIKQDWLMTEYRLPENQSNDGEKEWVLCVIYYKPNTRKN